jgi:hypothetical protein
MKQTPLIGFSLTLLMLLLVLVAAFVFSVQAQAALRARLDKQNNDLMARAADGTRTAVSAAAVLATRDTLSGQLATAAAERDTLNTQFTEKLLEIETFSTRSAADLAAIQTQLDGLRQEIASQGPVLALEVLASPRAEGDVLRFLAAASDLQGIALLEVAYNDGSPTPYAGENQPLFTHVFSQTIAEAGPYIVRVTVYNGNQITATELITGTVETAETFLQTEINTTLQQISGQSSLVPASPPILMRRPVFNQWLAAQFGNLLATTVTQQARVLQAFGLITAAEAIALPASIAQWYSADFAALYYDPAREQFLLLDEATLARELPQWLLVQEATTPTEVPPENSSPDALLGFQGQILGEATLRQGLYLAAAGETAVSLNTSSAFWQTLPGLPAALRAQLLFPYVQGYQWALANYQQGGPEAVTAARQPQASTALVLFGGPLAPTPVTLPDLPALLGPEWQLQGQGMWGAFRLQQMLAGPLGAEGETAVAGWAGDQYAVYWHEADDALLLALLVAWSSAADAALFNASFDRYASTLTGGNAFLDAAGGVCWPGSAEVFCRFEKGGGTLLVRAPSATLATAVNDLP